MEEFPEEWTGSWEVTGVENGSRSDVSDYWNLSPEELETIVDEDDGCTIQTVERTGLNRSNNEVTYTAETESGEEGMVRIRIEVNDGVMTATNLESEIDPDDEGQKITLNETDEDPRTIAECQ